MELIPGLLKRLQIWAQLVDYSLILCPFPSVLGADPSLKIPESFHIRNISQVSQGTFCFLFKSPTEIFRISLIKFRSDPFISIGIFRRFYVILSY
jgi:hypothetical protein